MTQRTLIARLGDIEKALEAIEGGGGVQGEVATAALTDVGELVKEAEGQPRSNSFDELVDDARAEAGKAPVTTDKQNTEFETVTRPVIEWLNANFHPHVTVVIDPTSAVLSEGAIAYTTHDYVRD